MSDDNQDIQSWMQQKGEHSKSFFYFTVYRDLGPARTIEKVIDEVKEIQRRSEDDSNIYPIPTMSSLVQLSASKGWVERCRAWDEHLDKVARTKQELKVKEMVERHAEDSKSVQEAVLKVKDDPEFKGLTLTQQAWVLNTTTHSLVKLAGLERVSRGEPSEMNQEDDDKPDKTAEEIEDLFTYAEGGNEDGDD